MIIIVAGHAYECSGATMGPGELRTHEGPVWNDITFHDVMSIDGQPTGVRGGDATVHLNTGLYEFRRLEDV